MRRAAFLLALAGPPAFAQPVEPPPLCPLLTAERVDAAAIGAALADGADPRATCPVIKTRRKSPSFLEFMVGVLIPPVGLMMLASDQREAYTIQVLPLAMAIGRQSEEAVDALIAAGADPLDADPRGHRALSAAITVDLATDEARWTHRLLGDRALPPDLLCHDVRALDQLRTHDVLRQRLERAGLAPGGQDCDGRTWLHRAAARSPDEVREILDQGVVPIDVPDQRGRTALYAAADAGRWETVALLRERGARLRGAGGDVGTILHPAAAAGERALMEEALAAGVDPLTRSESGSTPLSLAVDRRQDRVVAVLLEAGGLGNPSGSLAGEMVRDAAGRGSVGVLTLLLEAGAPADAPGPFGRTALAGAWHADQLDVARVLVAHGARPGGTSDPSWVRWEPPPLDEALRAHRQDWLSVLLPAATPRERQSALVSALIHRDHEAAAVVAAAGVDLDDALLSMSWMQQPEEMAWLRERGARFPDDAVLELVPDGSAEVVAQALSDGAAWDQPTHRGDLPVVVALRADRLDLVALLVEAGAVVGVSGTARLESALWRKEQDQALRLVELGAAPQDSTWREAVRSDQGAVVAALLDRHALSRWQLRRWRRLARWSGAEAAEAALDAALHRGR